MSTDNNKKLKGYFKKQFPNGNESETYVVEQCDQRITQFKDCNTDIGWVMERTGAGSDNGDITLYKKCLGVVYCDNKACVFHEKEMRPKSSMSLIKKQQCYCKQPMKHKPCHVKVKFSLSYIHVLKQNSCSFKSEGRHTHDAYARKHMSGDSKSKFTEKVRNDPYTTPKKMTTGISSRTGEITSAAREIDPILSNKDRVKYELNVARSALGIHKSSEFLGEFQNIQKEFEGYITYAEVATKEKFIIVFTPPGIRNYRLPFATQPIITDVTYKAVSGDQKYLCSSVIFVPEMDKSIVFFQAVLGGLSAASFAQYFIQLFEQMKLTKQQFLGMIMDFSSAQRLGFIHAFNYYFHNSANGIGSPSQMDEAQSFLKGCYMHWMQSVQRLVKNHSIVPPDAKQKFLQLVYRLRRTDSQLTFVETVLDLSVNYPNCRRWLRWWLQPSVSSMIFAQGSKMKASLAKHPMRTSNSVESFHSMLYSTMNEKVPLPLAMRQLLQIAKNDLESLRCYFVYGIPVKYGTKKRHRPNKTLANFYAESDSRAPDNTEALLGDEGLKVNQGKKKQEQEEQLYFEKMKEESQKRSSQFASNDEFDPYLAEEFAKKDEELIFGAGIRSEEDLMYDAIADLTPLKSIVDDPKRSEVTTEDLKEFIPAEYDAILCDHQGDECAHVWTQQSVGNDDDKASLPDVVGDGDCDLPDVTDDWSAPDVDAANNHSADVKPSSMGKVDAEHRLQSLVLNRNARNSCYIDAPFELLLRSVLPYIKDSFLRLYNRSNSFDKALFDAFYQYEEGSPIVGNQLLRNFAWKHGTPFVAGQMDDTYFFFQWYMTNMSNELRSLLSFCSSYEMCMCTESNEHSSINERIPELLPFVRGDYPTMKDYYSIKKAKTQNDQEQQIALLQARFEEVHHLRILYNKRQNCRCNTCGNTSAYKVNLIDQAILPEFLFLADPTNRDHTNYNKDGQLKEANLQVFFPEEFTVNVDHKKLVYQIHARVYSTHPQGLHYYSIGKVLSAVDQQELYKFDNLCSSANLLDTITENNKCPKPLKVANNTVLICYKRKN